MERWSIKGKNGYMYYGGGINKGKRVHRLLAEKIFGKPLPAKSIVHHVDGDTLNNDKSNLVICENQEYHKFLHMRHDALKISGDKNKRKCSYCQAYDLQENLRVKPNGGFYHYSCEMEYYRVRRERSKAA